MERFPAYSRPPGKYADQLRLIAVDAYVAVRKINAAEALVNELITEGKADRVLLVKKASILGVQARFDEARELLLELNRQHPNDRLILKKLVLVNEQLRDAGKAAAYLRALIALGEPDAWAVNKLKEFTALGSL